MATAFSKKPLTKQNLEQHSQLLPVQPATDAVTTWLEKVIAEEQTHRSSSRMSKALADMQLKAGDVDIDDYLDCLEQGMRSSFTAATADADYLKMFEQQRPFMYIETPLERYLTPGSSDPSYFSRPTLANMGFRYGAKRSTDMTRDHVKATKEEVLHAPETSSR